MKAILLKSSILPVLNRLQGITGRKTNLAITTNVLIKARNGNVTVVATDIETSFTGIYTAQIENEGSVLLNARKFFEIVREFPQEEIHLSDEDNTTSRITIGNGVTSGSGKIEYSLVCMELDEFPTVTDVENLTFFEMEAAALSKIIERSIVINGSADERRVHIVGTELELFEDGDHSIFRMVSTDGSRLSVCDYNSESKAMLLQEPVIISKKSLSEVNKFLDGGEVVKVAVKGSDFIVKIEAETIIIKLMEGNFPAYRPIVEKSENATDVKLNRHNFLNILKRLLILSSDSYRGALFDFNENVLTVKSNNPDIGESIESLEIEYGGQPMQVMFNPRFLIETINLIEEDDVYISLVNGEMPCLIKGADDDKYVTVTMPMRI